MTNFNGNIEHNTDSNGPEQVFNLLIKNPANTIKFLRYWLKFCGASLISRVIE